MTSHDTEIHYRTACPTDAAALSDLASRTFFDTFASYNTAEDMAMYLAKAYSVEQLASELQDRTMATLVAEASGALIAFAQLRFAAILPALPSPTPADAPVEIWRFYVDRAWHGRGVAHALMAHVNACAASNGGRTLWLGVWERNTRGIAFYRKAGFVDVGEQQFVLGTDVQNDRVMQRAVSSGSAPHPDARGGREPRLGPDQSMVMHTNSPDFDAWTVPPFSQYDGIEGIYCDDERVIVDMWSPWHAQRVNVRLPIARARVRAAEWRLANVSPRGDVRLIAKAEHEAAQAKAEVAELEHKRDLLEASRVRESAWPGWTWA